MKTGRAALALLGLFALAAAPACTVAPEGAPPGAADDEEDLTSLTARERQLTFEGFVYVDANASSHTILQAVRHQTKSAFGALREADIGANTRELGDIDQKTFVQEKVDVVDPSSPGAPAKQALRVRYRYTDRAVVPIPMARRTAVSLGLLHGSYESQSDRILKECTGNTDHDREFESSIWYVFNPTLRSCKDAITAEQIDIDKARKGLTSPSKQVVPAEVARLYVPMTARLAAKTTSAGTKYPEYDRLWAGGVEPGKLVVGIVSGVMADWAAGEKKDTIDDIGYTMFFEQFREIKNAHPKLALVRTDPAVDLSSFTANGKTVTGVAWDDIVRWELDRTGFPSSIGPADQRALRVAVGEKIARVWLGFEEPVSVKIGSGSAKDVTLKLNVYYGAETNDAPHRRALKTSDVFIYNGHSYIGYGPLDPSRYAPSDFPPSYQILFVNGCVSFNYYEKDFFKLHAGGTQNLDMVTNGLESWVNGSGKAMGRFVARLLDGKQASWAKVLEAAQFTDPWLAYEWGKDALRVVDGEVDNKYKPSTKPITVTIK